MSGHALGVVETNIPARLDRLPWSRFHWMVVIGLGTVWILDGLEVTMVGSLASRLTEKGSGIELTAGQVGTAAAIYVVGACLGALFFGQLTDRFGRKKLFLITLVVYVIATVATAFAFAPWFFYLTRFFTGAGIGGEYAAINSAIDELIPARVRGRVDLLINGSFWVGAACGSAAAVLFLDESIFPKDIGWRLAFGIGAVIGLVILVIRRHVPESPRWLFIHGREEEAEAIVDGIEQEIEEGVGRPLPEPSRTIRVRQRETIPVTEIAKVAFVRYPKRAVLGLALFVGQAFIYNGVTFNLGVLITTFYGVSSGFVPVFLVIFAVGNFMGPLVLGRLFDTVGRKPMISGSYIGSAIVTAVLTVLFVKDVLNEWSFIALVVAAFFLASSGASAAYLTVSEIFPMETRALAIAFFYAIGTAVGGITGPLLFGNLIATNDRGDVAIAFVIGAVAMAIGGIAEILFGVKAEQAELESIAAPLTAEEAEAEAAPEGAPAEAREPDLRPARREAEKARGEAERARARAADHRARAHEARAAAAGDERAPGRAEIEDRLAEIAELEARAHDDRAAAQDERLAADEARGEADRAAALGRAGAAEERARGHEEAARALGARDDEEAALHQALAEAAADRARAGEQRAEAARARAEAEGLEGARADAARARADLHERWAEMHDALARAKALRADGREDEARGLERDAAAREERALAAEQRLDAARHLVAAEDLAREEARAGEAGRRRAEADEELRRARELEDRIRARMERRARRERQGLRRYRPGPGTAMYSPWMAVGPAPADDGEDLDREIAAIGRALEENGPTRREDLARMLGARYWGPGRFRAALREALEEGRARRLSRDTLGPAEDREPAGSGRPAG
jgi:MFS family permease